MKIENIEEFKSGTQQKWKFVDHFALTKSPRNIVLKNGSPTNNHTHYQILIQLILT